jgi:hypothetical protein
MLKLRDVVNSVCDYLEKTEGYKIPSRWPGHLTIFANHPDGGRLILDAYGENLWVTEKQTGPRGTAPDKVMNEQESLDCVARAFLKAACKLDGNSRQDGDIIAMAFPFTNSFWKYLKPLKGTLDRLGIVIFFVGGDKSVMKYDSNQPSHPPRLPLEA